MIITEWQMYWITRLDNLHEFFCITAIITGVIITFMCLLTGLHWLEEKDDDCKKPFKMFLLSEIGVLFLILCAILVPTTKEYAAIKVIPVIVNNEKSQELPGKLLNLADEWIDELKPKKENSDEH